MKSEITKSLKEVWDMKQALRDDFQNSGFTSFADFIADEMIELRKKYHFNFQIEKLEHEEQVTTV